MARFDINKYKVPQAADVDLKATRQNFEIFMNAYGSAREKVGKNRMPKMTQSFSPMAMTPHREYSGDAERFLIEREMYLPDYEELHQIFAKGYLSINNNGEEKTNRRRQVFMLRYIHGINVQEIADMKYLSKTTIVEESKIGLIQFCNATDLLITKEETKELVSFGSKSITI